MEPHAKAHLREGVVEAGGRLHRVRLAVAGAPDPPDFAGAARLIDGGIVCAGLLNFGFKQCDFLGMDALPNVELNKIAMMMAMRLFAFDLIACLKKYAGREFENLTV